MSDAAVAKRIAQGMREAASRGVPEGELESYLRSQLRGLDPAQRLEQLELLALELNGNAVAAEAPGAGAGEVQQLVNRFLGKGACGAGISGQELTDRFAASLDTLFESLNQIVSVINVTLLGQSPEMETIRQVIGSSMKGEGTFSIPEYLAKIQQSFVVAHDSFQSAAAAIMEEVLRELDPEALSAKVSGLKFGPLRKADLFDQYAEKHGRCRRWFSSGQFKERLLREFEKQCQLQLNGNAR